VANLQTPTYYVLAVKANSGITDLHQIVEKRMPVTILKRGGVGDQLQDAILDYYGLSAEKLKSFGGTITENYTRGMKADVILAFAGLIHADNYSYWPDLTERDDFKYLEMAPALRAKLVKDFHLTEQSIPPNLLRGVDRRIVTVARNGTVVYGRTDMPDDFAYILAKALDEHQDLLNWSHSFFSYNPHTVWKALDVPLHPGAARYYKERGYMK
jgi:TRAP-type uncharacterized transport system substrate-binding protein